MKVVIIKYNAGNVFSMSTALKRIGIDAVITDNADEIKYADKVILPGVGEASSAMLYLKKKNLDTLIQQLKQPFLGVCLGLQLLCAFSEENKTTCLGIFDENIKKFPPTYKSPQVGWNNIAVSQNPLFKGIGQNSYVYFLHSYYAEIGKDTIATTQYSVPFSAALNKNNFYGVQFHPEKSGKIGENILRNFIGL